LTKSQYPGDSQQLPLTDAEIDELAYLLQEFITAPTFYRKQRLVENNQLLLTSEADSSLALLIMEYDEQPDLKQSFLLHRSLLQRSREIGIHQAFIEMRRTLDAAPLTGSFEQAQTEALVNTIGEFITKDSWDESRSYLDDHPELLYAQTDSIIEQLIRTHTTRGENKVVRELIIHRDLLRCCRDIGTEAAFDLLANPPETLDIITRNTIEVFTTQKDRRDAWEQIVQMARIRAAELSDAPMLELLRAISQVLRGMDPGDIVPALDGLYAESWNQIADGIRASLPDDHKPAH